MYDVWFRTEEVAQLLNITSRDVRYHCNNNKFKTRKIKSSRGHQGWEIALSSLPEAAVDKIRTREYVPTEMNGLTKRQKDEACKRFDILKKWENYAKERKQGSSKVVDEFIIEELRGEVSRASLYNWKSAYKKQGLLGLSPGKREKSGISEKTYSPEAMEFISDLYCNQNQLCLKEAWQKAKKAAGQKGWRIGSYSTIKKFFQGVPKYVKERRRKGEKRFKDVCVPAIERDRSDLKPYQIIVGDHHQLDIAVLHNGKVINPWLTALMDDKSGKITGWVLVSKPNSDSIALSFYDSCIRYGIPGAIYTDKGKDYRAKMFTGGSKYRLKKDKNTFKVSLTTEIRGLFDSLGVEVIQAIAYNAQAKPIEKFFDILESKFCKYFRGYRGRNIKQRPEKLAREIKNNDILTFEELKSKLRDWLEYEYNAQYEWSDHSKQAPNEVFFGQEWERKMVREEELILFCSRPIEKRVERNGIRVFGKFYWCDEAQINHWGNQVLVRYHPDYIDKVYVFDREDRFVGIAYRRFKGRYGMDREDYEKLNGLKKVMREAEKAAYKKLVPNPMSAREREALAVDSEAAAKFVEPLDRLPAKLVDTRFTPVFVQEALEKEKAKEQKEREKSLEKYLEYFIPPERKPGDEIDIKAKANKYLDMFR